MAEAGGWDRCPAAPSPNLSESSQANPSIILTDTPVCALGTYNWACMLICAVRRLQWSPWALWGWVDAGFLDCTVLCEQK